MIQDKLLEHIQNIKIINSGTKIMINGRHADPYYRGFVRIEVNKVRCNIWEKTSSLEIRRTLLKHVDKNLRQKHVKKAKVRILFYDLARKLQEIADSAAEVQEQKDAPGEFNKKVKKAIDDHQEAQRLEANKRNMKQLEGLLRDHLPDLDEDVLIDLYRRIRVEQVMES
jgi:hypothetical protein